MATTAVSHDLEAVNRIIELTRERIAPRAARYDEEVLSPVENWNDLWQEGFLAMTVPREHGGMGTDPLTYIMVLEEIAKGCTNTSMTLHMHSTVMRFIDALGTPQQKARLFPEVVQKGKLFGSWAAERGTSFSRQPFVTTAIRKAADGYVIQGQKTFCTMVGAASYYGIWCSLDGSDDMGSSMVFALVPADTPGLKVLGDWNTLGMRGTVSPAVELGDCAISAEMVLGAPGAPLRVGVVEAFSLGYGAIFLGAASGALDHTIEYCKTAIYKPDPNPIASDPATQRDVAKIAIHLEAARLLLYDCASRWDQADVNQRGLLAAKAKYLCTEAATIATQEALRVVGGRAASKSFPIERAFRDVHTCTLMPPSVNSMLVSIGKDQFGLLEPMYSSKPTG